MAERSKALDSKSSKGQLFGGSNPPLSVFFFLWSQYSKWNKFPKNIYRRNVPVINNCSIDDNNYIIKYTK